MDTDYEQKHHALEQYYWWWRGRHNSILRNMRHFDRDSHILDVGCSIGVMIQKLQKQGFSHVAGVDISERAIAVCGEKGLQDVHVADAQNIQVNDNAYDIIIASDILEHIEEDVATLEEWCRILKPRGRVLVYVPAFMFLWTTHDEDNQHARRYTKKELVEKLRKAGFEIERASYWNVALFIPVGLFRIIKKALHLPSIRKGDHALDVHPVINSMLSWWLLLENFLFSKLSAPFGISVYVIARVRK